MDSYSSYINLKFMQVCEDYKIILICLLPYIIHLLQPLDLIIFLQLKCLYSSKVDKYIIYNITGINKEFFEDFRGDLPSDIYPKTN